MSKMKSATDEWLQKHGTEEQKAQVSSASTTSMQSKTQEWVNTHGVKETIETAPKVDVGQIYNAVQANAQIPKLKMATAQIQQTKPVGSNIMTPALKQKMEDYNANNPKTTISNDTRTMKQKYADNQATAKFKQEHEQNQIKKIIGAMGPSANGTMSMPANISGQRSQETGRYKTADANGNTVYIDNQTTQRYESIPINADKAYIAMQDPNCPVSNVWNLNGAEGDRFQAMTQEERQRYASLYYDDPNEADRYFKSITERLNERMALKKYDNMEATAGTVGKNIVYAGNAVGKVGTDVGKGLNWVAGNPYIQATPQSELLSNEMMKNASGAQKVAYNVEGTVADIGTRMAINAIPVAGIAVNALSGAGRSYDDALKSGADYNTANIKGAAGFSKGVMARVASGMAGSVVQGTPYASLQNYTKGVLSASGYSLGGDLTYKGANALLGKDSKELSWKQIATNLGSAVALSVVSQGLKDISQIAQRASDANRYLDDFEKRSKAYYNYILKKHPNDIRSINETTGDAERFNKEANEWYNAYTEDVQQVKENILVTQNLLNELDKAYQSGLYNGNPEGFNNAYLELTNRLDGLNNALNEIEAQYGVIGGVPYDSNVTPEEIGGTANYNVPNTGTQMVSAPQNNTPQSYQPNFTMQMDMGQNVPQPSQKTGGAKMLANPDDRTEKFNMIQANNPKDNTLSDHTWVESPKDVKTFAEVNAQVEDVTPDFTKTDVQNALESGKITLYSSNPIKEGAFVTPSKMEAQNYAGEGKVYSIEASTDDVAWIDNTQGQYAPTKSIAERNNQTLTLSAPYTKGVQNGETGNNILNGERTGLNGDSQGKRTGSVQQEVRVAEGASEGNLGQNGTGNTQVLRTESADRVVSSAKPNQTVKVVSFDPETTKYINENKGSFEVVGYEGEIVTKDGKSVQEAIDLQNGRISVRTDGLFTPRAYFDHGKTHPFVKTKDNPDGVIDPVSVYDEVSNELVNNGKSPINHGLEYMRYMYNMSYGLQKDEDGNYIVDEDGEYVFDEDKSLPEMICDANSWETGDGIDLFTALAEKYPDHPDAELWRQFSKRLAPDNYKSMQKVISKKMEGKTLKSLDFDENGYKGMEYSVEPPFKSDEKGQEAQKKWVASLEPDARKTYDLLGGIHELGANNPITLSDGKGGSFTADLFTRVYKPRQWNELLDTNPEAARLAKEATALLPPKVKNLSNLTDDGHVKLLDRNLAKPEDKEYFESILHMPRTFMQRVVDSLPEETGSSTYKIEGKDISLSDKKEISYAGGEKYREAIVNEIRDQWDRGEKPSKSLEDLKQDTWGAMGFITDSSKTGLTADWTTFCPQMFINQGCWYCYRGKQLSQGFDTKKVGLSIFYAGDVNLMSQRSIDKMNKDFGGLRIQSSGDWFEKFSAQLADLAVDADSRGLDVKIVTKSDDLVDLVLRLKEQGIGKRIYMNISTDRTVEELPMEFAGVRDIARPYLLKKAEDGSNKLLYKRAMAISEAWEQAKKDPEHIYIRTVASNNDEFIKDLKDPRVSVITGLHGTSGKTPRYSSETGELLTTGEELGKSGMPLFDKDGNLVRDGKLPEQKALAKKVQDLGLGKEYAYKVCCQEGHCSKCLGKCGRNVAANLGERHDIEGGVDEWWQKNMTATAHDDKGNRIYKYPQVLKSEEFRSTLDDDELKAIEKEQKSYALKKSKKGTLVGNSQLTDNEDTAIYIRNTRMAKYAKQIFSDNPDEVKTLETRDNRSLDEYVGKPYYITDGKYVYGKVVFGKPFEITADKFHTDEFQSQHRVPEGDKYDVKDGKSKWAYPIESKEAYPERKPLNKDKSYKYSYQARQIQYSSSPELPKDYALSKPDKKEKAPTFYSKLQREIEGFKGDKLGANSVESYLKGKGVKEEEIKWSGIRTFLEGKKSVSKGELMDFLKANQLQIQEKTLTQSTEASIKKYAEEYGNKRGYDTSKIEIVDYNDYYDTYEIQFADGESVSLKASDFPDGTKWSQYKLDGGENYREILFKVPNSSYSNSAMSTHWGDTGVLAHARVQDFKTPDDKKVLFIDEIQSDWHNAGQKNGYGETTLTVNIEPHEWYGHKNKVKSYVLYVNGKQTNQWMPVGEMKDKTEQEVIDYLAEDIDTDGVPEVPFSKNYTDYVLKVLLRQAAENGYDYLAWTTGKMQEERWSNEYSEGYRIEYDQDIPKFLNKYGKQWGAKTENIGINAERNYSYQTPDGENYDHIRQWIDATLDNYFGKDNKIWSAYLKGDYKIREIGDTIRIVVGGEMLPDKLQVVYEDVIVPSIPINESMKQSVLYEGQPMYSAEPELPSGYKPLLKPENNKLKYTEKDLEMALDNEAKKFEKLETKRRERELLRKGDRLAREQLFKELRKLERTKVGPELEAMKADILANVHTMHKGIRQDTLDNILKFEGEVDLRSAADADYAKIQAIQAKKIIDRAYKLHTSEMTAQQVKDYHDAVSFILTQQQYENRTRKINKGKEIFETAKQFETELSRINDFDPDKKLKYKWQKYTVNSLSMERAMDYLSGYQPDSVLAQIKKSFLDANEKYNDITMKAEKMIAPQMGNKDYVKYLAGDNPEHIYTIYDKNGRSAKVTPDMLIDLAMAVKNYDVRRSMANGGLQIPNIELYKKARTEQQRDYAYARGTNLKLKPSDIEEAIKQMSDEDRKMADVIWKWYNGGDGAMVVSGDLVNEVSRIMDGYEKATMKDYYPKSVYGAHINKQIGVQNNPTLPNSSFTKERTDNTLPVKLMPATERYKQSYDAVARYNAFTIPLDDFNKIYNTTFGYDIPSIKEQIASKYGDIGNTYLETLVDDLQRGGRPHNPDVLDFAQENYILSSFAANLRIIAAQFTSYPMASSVLHWDSLLKGLQSSNKNLDIDYIDSITPMYYARRKGMNEADVGRVYQGNSNSKWKAFLQMLTSKIQGSDVFTTGHLATACMYEMEKYYPDYKKGTSEYNTKLAQLINETYRKTQPSFDLVFKSEYQKRHGVGYALMNMFKTATLNMGGDVLDSFYKMNAYKSYSSESNKDESGKWSDAERQYYKEEAKKASQHFRKTGAAFFMSQALYTLVRTAYDFLMHDVKKYRNDEGEIDVGLIAYNYGVDLFGNMIGGFYGGSLVGDALKTAFTALTTGEAKFYDQETPSLANLNAFYEAFTDTLNNVHDSVAGETEDDKAKARENFRKAVILLGKSASKVFGFPADQVMKYGNAIYQYAQDIGNGELYSSGKTLFGLSDKSVTEEQYANRALKAYTEGDIAKGDKAVTMTSTNELIKTLQTPSDKKEDVVPALIDSPYPEEVQGNIYAEKWPSKNLDTWIDMGGTAYQYMVLEHQGNLNNTELEAMRDRNVDVEKVFECVENKTAPKRTDVKYNGFGSKDKLYDAIGSANANEDWHHIVEQSHIDINGIKAEDVQNSQNVVSIKGGAKSMHDLLSRYYASKQSFTGDKTVSDWLADKSFDEQWQFGVDYMSQFGQLVPADDCWYFIPYDNKQIVQATEDLKYNVVTATENYDNWIDSGRTKDEYIKQYDAIQSAKTQGKQEGVIKYIRENNIPEEDYIYYWNMAGYAESTMHYISDYEEPKKTSSVPSLFKPNEKAKSTTRAKYLAMA